MGPLLVPVENTRLDFVPFHAVFLGLLLSPARAAKARHPPIVHQHGQVRGGALGLAFLGNLFQTKVCFFFGLFAQPLHQTVDHRVIDRATPLTGQLRGLFIGTGHRGGKSQLLFQRRTHLLVRLEAPPFFDGTTPRPLFAVLTLPDFEFNDAVDAAQMHHLFSPMPRRSAAEGEKSRRGGRPPVAVFLPAAAGSIPGLRPMLPFRSRAVSVAPGFPSASVGPFVSAFSSCSDEEPVYTAPLWWWCQDAPHSVALQTG